MGSLEMDAFARWLFEVTYMHLIPWLEVEMQNLLSASTCAWRNVMFSDILLSPNSPMFLYLAKDGKRVQKNSYKKKWKSKTYFTDPVKSMTKLPMISGINC